MTSIAPPAVVSDQELAALVHGPDRNCEMLYVPDHRQIMDGIPCARPAAVEMDTVCPHRHKETARVCRWHLDRFRSGYSEVCCTTCADGGAGHRCRAIILRCRPVGGPT